MLALLAASARAGRRAGGGGLDGLAGRALALVAARRGPTFATGPAYIKKRANELRVGAVVALDNGSTLGVIEKYLYTQGSGRQLGVVQATLRTVGGAVGGSTVQARWRPGDDVAVARLEERACTLLYRDATSGGFVLMDSTDYEQVEVPAALFEPTAASLLPDGAGVTLTLGPDGAPVAAAPSSTTVEVTIAEAPPAKTGAAPGFKTAVTDTGAAVRVPNHVRAGDRVSVGARDGAFKARVEKGPPP